jgi:tetratricopeptide (TPR) repeat protein
MTKDFLKRPIVHVLLVIILSLIAYSNTFHVPFQFDDKFVIVKNPIIKDLQYFTEPSKAELFKGHFEYNTFKRRYIGYLTFALNYRIHGIDTTGYHVVNLFIHICNALLIYLLVSLTFETPSMLTSGLRVYSKKIALFTALLFACHPLQTQAVTYIWQRVTSLSTLFYLLSLVLYIKVRLNQTKSHKNSLFNVSNLSLYLLCLFSASLAMKTKEISFMLPLSTVLYEFMFFKGRTVKRILLLFPLILTMLIIPLTLFSIDKPAGELIDDVGEITRGHTYLSRTDYLITSIRVLITYLRLVILPVGQNFIYDYPKFHSFMNFEVIAAFLFLTVIAGCGVYIFQRYRHTSAHVKLISYGIFWFFINLSLESSVIPLYNIIFEHRMYLPSIGVFLAISTFLFMVFKRYGEKQKEKVFFSLLTIIVVLLTLSSYVRNSIWKSETSLWQDVLSKNPNHDMAYSDLGHIYYSQGLLEKAMENYQTAIKINPDNAIAYNNIGIVYASKGFFQKAIDYFQTALKIDPELSYSYNNLGNIYRSQGLIDKAIGQYETAINLDPAYSEAHNNLGKAYAYKGLYDKAKEYFKIAIKLDPNYSDAYFALGVVYHFQGLKDKAAENYIKAIRFKPDWDKPHFNLGRIYFDSGYTEKARREFEKVLQINPQDQKARNLLDSILYRKK